MALLWLWPVLATCVEMYWARAFLAALWAIGVHWLWHLRPAQKFQAHPPSWDAPPVAVLQRIPPPPADAVSMMILGPLPPSPAEGSDSDDSGWELSSPGGTRSRKVRVKTRKSWREI